MFMMWSVDNVVFLISILFYFQILVFQKKTLFCTVQRKQSLPLASLFIEAADRRVESK